MRKTLDTLFVCNTSSDSISVINLDLFLEERRIPLKMCEYERVLPQGICAYKNNLLIANNYSNSISKINLKKDNMQQNYFIGMNCNDVDVCEDNAFVICGDSNTIVRFNLVENKIEEEIPCGNFPHSIEICKEKRKIITANMYSDSITIYDYMDTNSIVIKRVGEFPTKAIFNEDGSNIIVCESNIGCDKAGSISILSTKDLKLISKIQVGDSPIDMCFENNICYISNFGDGTVSVVDINKNIEIKRIETGGMPRGVIVKNGVIYVGDSYNNLLLNINLNNKKRKSISIGKEPTGMIIL